jgi:hypothetical protein
MMWMIWALIIFGVVWDAADSFTLRHAERDQCVGVARRAPDDFLSVSKCVAENRQQTWLWEGKRLKNKSSGKCIVVRDNPDKRPNWEVQCLVPELEGITKKHHDDHNERTEYTRTGEHGLKNSKGKCLKFPKLGKYGYNFQLGNCTEDEYDPYYE